MLANRSTRSRIIRGAAGTLAAIASTRSTVRAQTINWRCGAGNGGSTPVNVRLVEAFAKIRNETHGELDVKHYPDSQLGSDPALVSQVRLGALEMMTTAGGQLDSLVPVAAIENAPFAFANYETAWRAFDGDVGKIVRAGLMSVGFYVFERPYDNGFRQFTTNPKPVKSVDDLQGLRIRVPTSRFRIDVFRSLGASPTPFAYNELYTALQTHVIDGQETPLVSVESDRFYEVQKYCSLTNHMWGAFWVFVNRAKWDGLPPRLQAVMTKNINAVALLQRKDDERLDVTLVDKLSRQGMMLNKVDGTSFKATLKSTGFYRRWRDEWGATVWNALEKYSGPLT